MKKFLVPVLLTCLIILPFVTAHLRVGFYNSTCPRAERIVRQVVQKRFHKDPSITGALLHMLFHDCFVQGCDASILIDSRPEKSSEKDAGPSGTLREYDLIDEAKYALEHACPETVSCADILTLATRDTIALAGGVHYPLPTGRRDGLISDPSLVKLPSPFLTISQALEFFTRKGLTINDMVTLLGAHTVGHVHCGLFRDRLFNFTGTGKPDPAMDPALVSDLSKICGTQSRPLNEDPTAFLDQNKTSSFVVDNSYFKQLKSHRGVTTFDNNLALDKSSGPIVSTYAANPDWFQKRFAKVMVKMSGVDVLVGSAGEIRKNCRVFNSVK